MASLKDGTGYGDSSQGSRDVEFLPLVADVVGWIGLFVCAVGVLLLLGEWAAAVSEHTRQLLWQSMVLGAPGLQCRFSNLRNCQAGTSKTAIVTSSKKRRLRHLRPTR
jgi:hypothetical protein